MYDAGVLLGGKTKDCLEGDNGLRMGLRSFLYTGEKENSHYLIAVGPI